MTGKLEYIPPGTVIGLPAVQPISFLKSEYHPKAWGQEIWWVNNDKYCAKSLRFDAGKEFSDHFHWLKEETWICVSGELVLEYYDLSNADKLTKTIGAGDVIHIPPGNPHKLRAVTDALIWEVSSKHYESDSYRIGKGSSQSKDPQANTISFPGSSGKPFDYGRWGMGATSPTQDYGKRVRLDKDSWDPRGGRNVGEVEGVVEEVRPVSCAWAVYIRTDDGRLVCANPYQCHLVTDAKESGWKS